MADGRGPRLLSDLNNAFRRDPNINEYDILPVTEPKHNRSPFILQDHKLGLEAWAMKILLKYSANRLLGWQGRSIEEKFLEPAEICELSRAVLLFNPDNYTAWNIRKEMIENGHLSISEDLEFGALVLTKNPKSPETFIHRRWLFQQLLEHCLSSSSGSNASYSAGAGAANSADVLVNVDAIDVDIGSSPEPGERLNGAFSLESSRLLKSCTLEELKLSERAADGYASNYHAWSHRIWVVQHCFNCSLQVLMQELQGTQNWVSRHISDHSGFHYRQFLLSEIHSKRAHFNSSFSCTSNELFRREMDFVCDLIRTYPGHEALWYHRKFLVSSLISPDHLEGNGDDAANSLRSTLLSQELESVSKKEAESSHKFQQTLARKYIKWLQRIC